MLKELNCHISFVLFFCGLQKVKKCVQDHYISLSVVMLYIIVFGIIFSWSQYPLLKANNKSF